MKRKLLVGVLAGALVVASALAASSPLLTTTASLTSTSVSFGGDSWAYQANASWTDPGLASYDWIDYTCYYYDSTGALVTSISTPVAPTSKLTVSPVTDSRSGTFGGTAYAKDYYTNMNPKWKTRVATAKYEYHMYVSVGTDANEASSGVSDTKVFTSASFVPW